MNRRFALLAGLPLAIGSMVAATSIPASAATYQEIKSEYGNQLCLSAEDNAFGNPNQNGDAVNMWSCFGGSSQEWFFDFQFTATGTIELTIINKSGKCLDAEKDQYDNPDNAGDFVQLWTCNGQANQNWDQIPGSNGCAYENESAYDDGFDNVLDAETANGFTPNTDGDPVQLFTTNGHSNQLWTCG